jgi:nucleoside-diphosphate-sugar epimerase
VTRAQAGGQGTILFGGSGFLGEYVLRADPAIVSVGRTTPAAGNRHVPVASLDDLSALSGISFDKVVFIIGNSDNHGLASEETAPGERTAYDYHLLPLLRALEQLKRYPIRRFLHFSTILLYDEKKIRLPVSEDAPIDPYRNRHVFAKFLAEEACRFYARWIPIVNVRLANVYGPTRRKRFNLINVLVDQLLEAGKARVRNTRPERDFLYVEDAAEAIVALLEADGADTVNLGSGTMTSVERIVNLLEDLSGCPIENLDEPVDGPMRFRCDMSRLEKLVAWRPRVGIEEGVRRTWETTKSWKKLVLDPAAAK